MKAIPDVWADYQTLVSNPDTTPELREAFWRGLEEHFPAEAVSGLRRAVEFFFSDELQGPSTEEPSADQLELYELWGRGE
jgi:hypothetical protein